MEVGENQSISLIKDNYKLLYPTSGSITKEDRIQKNGHRPGVIWFTGLSGSGKSTLACKLEEQLFEKGYQTYVLDGDNIRSGLSKDLGFSVNDRKENIRRISEIAKLFADSGMIVITAFISPYKEDRTQARQLFDEGEFLEVYLKCPLEVCEKRDVKGLYKKARNGEVKGFTGLDDVYEEPTAPELVVETNKCSIEEAVEIIITFLQGRL